MGGVWKLYKAWQKAEPSTKVPPLLEDQLWALVGFYLVKRKNLRIAATPALGFTIFLRTLEILSLKLADCNFDAESGRILLRLILPKDDKDLGRTKALQSCHLRLLPFAV